VRRALVLFSTPTNYPRTIFESHKLSETSCIPLKELGYISINLGRIGKPSLDRRDLFLWGYEQESPKEEGRRAENGMVTPPGRRRHS